MEMKRYFNDEMIITIIEVVPSSREGVVVNCGSFLARKVPWILQCREVGARELMQLPEQGLENLWWSNHLRQQQMQQGSPQWWYRPNPIIRHHHRPIRGKVGTESVKKETLHLQSPITIFFPLLFLYCRSLRKRTLW